MEIWKQIWDHKNYEVSNLGRVRRKKNKRIRKLTKVNDYNTIRFTDKNPVGVHRLVFEAFYRRLLPNEDCHHINGIRDCNIWTNLVAKDKSIHLHDHKIGVKQTEEHKRNKANTRIGKKHSQQAKLKMSLAKKGKPSPNKGKKRSLEAVAKMIETRKLKKMLNPNYGPKRDEKSGQFLKNL